MLAFVVLRIATCSTDISSSLETPAALKNATRRSKIAESSGPTSPCALRLVLLISFLVDVFIDFESHGGIAGAGGLIRIV
jgi:hypothetical protein